MKPLAAAAFALAALLTPEAAQAGAWTLPAGTGQVIVTGIHSESPTGYDDSGAVNAIPRYTKDEAYVLVEYGVTDDVTLSVTPSYSHVDVPGGHVTSGLGTTQFMARYRLAANDSGVISVQAGLSVPGKRRVDTLAQINTDGTEVDIRALGGSNFKLGTLSAFADLEAGYRFRSGAPANEFHLDATLGLRPARRLTLMLQLFNTISDGHGRPGFPANRYTNLDASLVWDLSKRVGLQIGALRTLSGRNALRERGVFSALWFKF